MAVCPKPAEVTAITIARDWIIDCFSAGGDVADHCACTGGSFDIKVAFWDRTSYRGEPGELRALDAISGALVPGQNTQRFPPEQTEAGPLTEPGVPQEYDLLSPGTATAPSM